MFKYFPLSANSNLKQQTQFNPLIYDRHGQFIASQAILDWMNQLGTTYFCTIAFNPPTKHQNQHHCRDYFKKRLAKVLLQFDRNCLGTKYVHNKKHLPNRCSGFIIPEHESSNYHYHMLLKIPACDDVNLINLHFQAAFNQFGFARASRDIQSIYDKHELAEYVTKEFSPKTWEDKLSSIILVNEFHPEYK